MVRSFSLAIIRHCQPTEYTRKTTSANENKINIYLVRCEQSLENVDRKYLECLQIKMHDQDRRYKRQYKLPYKQVTIQDHTFTHN